MEPNSGKVNSIMYFVAILIVSVIILGFACINLGTENAGLKEDVNYYHDTYLFKSGSTSVNGENINYQLASFDSGKNWYVINTDNNEFKIVGLAEEVHPGLLKNIEGFENLIKYVEKHGAIKIGEPLSAEALKALNDAGITTKEEK